MNRGFSLYLDLVRFGAAMIVFFGHASGMHFTGGILWQFGAYLDTAVMIFFVLSGYVIAHVLNGCENTVRDYATARAARLYSICQRRTKNASARRSKDASVRRAGRPPAGGLPAFRN